MKKIFIGAFLSYVSSFVLATEVVDEKNNKVIEGKTSDEVEKEEYVPVYNLEYNKALLSEEENSCFVPFSSWSKSVNMYNNCSMITNGKNVVVDLISLQRKIRVVNENNIPYFFDRIKMKLEIDCSIVVKNTKFYKWEYFNREESLFKKETLSNVNWFLTNSSDELAKQICSDKLTDVYAKAVETQRLNEIKWKEIREKRAREEAKKKKK